MVLLVLFLLPIFALAAAQSADSVRRIDDILIWKIAEEMKLNPLEEDAFVAELQKVAKERRSVESKLSASLLQLKELLAFNQRDQKKILVEFKQSKALLRDSNRIAEDELKWIEKKFGSVKAARYLVSRRDVFRRIEESLAGEK